MKNRRKNLISLLVVGGILSISSTGVCAEDMSALDVLDAVAESTGNVRSMFLDGDLDVEASILLGEGDAQSNISLLIGGDVDIEYLVGLEEMPTMGMSVDVNVSALGQSENMKLKMFLEPAPEEEYHLAMYSLDGENPEGHWEYQVLDANDFGNINENQSVGLDLLEESGLEFVNSGYTDRDGKKCLDLNTQITFNDLVNAAENMGTSTDEVVNSLESDEMVKSILEALKLDIHYYVSEEFTPAGIYLTLNNSDMEVINSVVTSLLGEEGANFSINDVSFNSNIEYDTIDSVSFAEEARKHYTSDLEVTDEKDTGSSEDARVEDTIDIVVYDGEGREPVITATEDYSDSKYSVGEDIEPGVYMLCVADKEYGGFFSVYEDYDEENIVTAEFVSNNFIFELKDGDYLITNGLNIYNYTGEENLVFPNQGMFEVGKHIDSGVYSLEPGDDGGYWCIYDSYRCDNIVENNFIEEGVDTVTVEDGQLLIVDNCFISE